MGFECGMRKERGLIDGIDPPCARPCDLFAKAAFAPPGRLRVAFQRSEKRALVGRTVEIPDARAFQRGRSMAAARCAVQVLSATTTTAGFEPNIAGAITIAWTPG